MIRYAAAHTNRGHLPFSFFKRERFLRRKEKLQKVGDGFDPHGVGPSSHSLFLKPQNAIQAECGVR
jgi:hypothetical protein